MARLKRFLWRGKLRKAATILVGGFVVLVIISAVVPSQKEDKSAPPASQPEATSTEVEVKAAEPTETARPTDAPKATKTPGPTDTPEPTSPPKPSAEECDYLAEVASEYVSPLSESLPRLADLSYQAASDPTLIFDYQWKIDVATELAIWSMSHDRFASMTSPSSLTAFHAKFLDALNRLDSAGTLFAEGVDEFDPDKITRASAQMDEATALLGEANDLLTQFSSEHPGGC